MSDRGRVLAQALARELEPQAAGFRTLAGRPATLAIIAAKDDPAVKVAAAAEWDGDFLTKLDLWMTKDRRVCLSCHEAAVGMPDDFKKIDVAVHLEEQGASEPLSRETCFECHGGHDTAP